MMSRFTQNASLNSSPVIYSEDNYTSPIQKVLLLLTILILSNGCSTLMGKNKGPLDNLDTKGLQKVGYTFGEYGANKPILTEDGKPAIVLEVNNGKRHFEKIPLVPGQSLFIADLIRDAKLQKRIGRIRTTVLRPNGTNLPPIRLDVDFDDSGKHVMEGQNYSLRAGDHVVVSPDDRNALTSMFTEIPFMKR